MKFKVRPWGCRRRRPGCRAGTWSRTWWLSLCYWTSRCRLTRTRGRCSSAVLTSGPEETSESCTAPRRMTLDEPACRRSPSPNAATTQLLQITHPNRKQSARWKILHLLKGCRLFNHIFSSYTEGCRTHILQILLIQLVLFNKYSGLNLQLAPWIFTKNESNVVKTFSSAVQTFL